MIAGVMPPKRQTGKPFRNGLALQISGLVLLVTLLCLLQHPAWAASETAELSAPEAVEELPELSPEPSPEPSPGPPPEPSPEPASNLVIDAVDAPYCKGFAAQSPRDIASLIGGNRNRFAMAPPASDLNLCAMRVVASAEHKGPGFSLPAGDGRRSGFMCNDTGALTIHEQIDLTGGHGAFKGVFPGDTVEVQWIYSSCEVMPGRGLNSCFSANCANPSLRVESQVFLVVNDSFGEKALDIRDLAYDPPADLMAPRPVTYQPKALPGGTETALTYRGSTTGAEYSAEICSPYQVTWNVRQGCKKLSAAGLNAWAQSGNVFGITGAQDARPLITLTPLLAPVSQ